jgi:hypothetical protein
VSDGWSSIISLFGVVIVTAFDELSIVWNYELPEQSSTGGGRESGAHCTRGVRTFN